MATCEMDPRTTRIAPRLLIVDDESAVRQALREAFTGYGYSVDCAAEKEEAEAMLMHYTYDLVLSDLRLTDGHGKEGLDLVGIVKERCARTRVVLLTGRGSPEIEAEARRRGAAAFLEKPQPLSELRRLVEQLIGVEAR